jgi:hypothetical protein
MPGKVAVTNEPLDPLIRELRGARVILDADLARVYGVETRALNQAVKRNRERFPADFAFQLTAGETQAGRAQLVTGRSEGAEGDADNSSQFVMSSRRGAAYRPWAFTEHGALMAANVLRSDRAVQMSVYVVRAFVGLREQLAERADLMRRLDKLDEKMLEHDEALLVVWNRIKDLMRPLAAAPLPPKRRIGFQPTPRK